jgi:hypothetical protein
LKIAIFVKTGLKNSHLATLSNILTDWAVVLYFLIKKIIKLFESGWVQTF